MGTGVTLNQAHKPERQLFASDRWNNVALAGKQTVTETLQLIKYETDVQEEAPAHRRQHAASLEN